MEVSQPFRSCEMRFTVLQNGTRVPKVGFAAAKYPAKWSFGCEFGNCHALELRSCEMGAPVLRSGTRVPKVVSQQSADFAEAAKSRKPLFLPCFCSVFAPISLQKTSFNFFSIPLDFDHPKTYIT